MRSWTGRCRAPPGPMIRRRGPWVCCRDAPGTTSACGPPSVTNRGSGQSLCAAEQGGGDVLGFGRLWHGEMVGAGGCGEGLKGGAGDFGVRVWRGGSPWISAGDRGGALRARGRCGRRRKATLTSGPGVSVAERANGVRASSADRWARGRLLASARGERGLARAALAGAGRWQAKRGGWRVGPAGLGWWAPGMRRSGWAALD